MRRAASLRWALACLALGLGACVSTGGGATRAPGSELDALRARVAELERTVKVSEVELRRLRVQVAELEATIQGGAVEEPRSAPSAQERPAAPPLARGEVESSDLVLESERPVPPAVHARPPSQEGPPPALPAPLSAASQALYDRGYTLYNEGHYLDAETTFQQFLQGNSATELADNALYWIGESRFARRDLRGALAAFRETLERYPQGNKVPDALLKAADCLAGLGDREGARSGYEEVQRRFPATAAAETARQRQAALR